MVRGVICRLVCRVLWALLLLALVGCCYDVCCVFNCCLYCYAGVVYYL